MLSLYAPQKGIKTGIKGIKTQKDRARRRHGQLVTLPEGSRYCLCSGPYLLRDISNKYMNVYIYMLHTVNCSSTFKIVNLSHRHVLSYVNILKYLPGTYYMERLIIAKVAVNRSVLISVL